MLWALHPPQCKAKYGALLRGHVVGPQTTVMRLNDSPRERQPHAHAFRLCRKKGFKNLIDDGAWNPRSGILDNYFDFALLLVLPRLDENTSGIERARLHCVDAVHKEVEQHLRYVNAITKHARQPGRHEHGHCDML